MLISLQLCWVRRGPIGKDFWGRVMVGSFAKILRNSKAAKAPNQVKETYQRPIWLKGLSTMSAKPTSPIMLYSPTLESLAGLALPPRRSSVTRPTNPLPHTFRQTFCHDAALYAHRRPQAAGSACLGGALRPLGLCRVLSGRLNSGIRVSERFMCTEVYIHIYIYIRNPKE